MDDSGSLDVQADRLKTNIQMKDIHFMSSKLYNNIRGWKWKGRQNKAKSK